jgi:hypothetical protein
MSMWTYPMNNLDILVDVYLENLAASLNFHAPITQESAPSRWWWIYGNGRNVDHAKKDTFEAEQDSAKRTRNGEELDLR